MIRLILITFICIVSHSILAQGNVGIGTATPNGTSKLDISAVDKGTLITRVALAATNAASPVTKADGSAAATTDLATGLLVYNTATAGTAPNNVTPGFYYWDGAKWVKIVGNNIAWLLNGNTSTTEPAAPATYGTSTIGATENWLGTTDNKGVVLGTNNKERLRLDNAGNLGIGTATPAAKLDVTESTTAEAKANLANTSATSGNAGMEIRTGSAGAQEYIDFTNNATNSTTPDFKNRIISNNSNLQIQSTVGSALAIDNVNNNIGISNASPNGTSRLDITATNKGLLAPRVALASTNVAIPITKADGTAAATSDLPASLLVYNTTANGVAPNNVIPGFYNWDGTQWVRLLTNNQAWLLNGNTGTTEPAAPATYGTSTIGAAENWMGTTDNKGVVFGTNNKERLRLDNAGNLGIGTPTPTAQLDVTQNNASNAKVHILNTSTGNAGIDIRTTGANTLEYIDFTNSSTSNAATGTPDYKNRIISSNTSFQFASTTGIAIHVDNPTNNVGINTTTPSAKLDVLGAILSEGASTTHAYGAYLEWNKDGLGKTYLLNQKGSGTGGTVFGEVDAANTITERMRIDGPTGNVGIGTASPNANALVDMSSTSKGMLTPRLTTAQRNAMGNTLTEGLLIYNSDNNCFEYWDTKGTPSGGNGFWNSLCQWCENVVVIGTNQTAFNLNNLLGGFGGAKAKKYCVYVNAGVTISATANSGGSSANGNPGFDASTMPAGATVILYNYGSILGGGGNGGVGAFEQDLVCGGDAGAGNGGRGGDAIVTSSAVPVTCYNYGIVRAGGGGGGGGGWGCCAGSGGGGGGAGTPAGSGGGGGCSACVGGGLCACGARWACALPGATGTATAAGAGSTGVSNGAATCLSCSSSGTNGGNGGVNGATGNWNGGFGANWGFGGGAGYSLNGNGSGSSVTTMSGGTTTGTVVP